MAQNPLATVSGGDALAENVSRETLEIPSTSPPVGFSLEELQSALAETQSNLTGEELEEHILNALLKFNALLGTHTPEYDYVYPLAVTELTCGGTPLSFDWGDGSEYFKGDSYEITTPYSEHLTPAEMGTIFTYSVVLGFSLTAVLAILGYGIGKVLSVVKGAISGK